ncbi:MAG: protein translocase subunit SecD [Kiritimatiellae bacterium]|nr:protein translocase subunit SecD [Kiritimatiellia bacterium]
MTKENSIRNNVWKWLVLALLAAVSFHVTTPPKDKIRLGLDLKGGTSFVLGVDVDKLRENILAESPSLTNDAAAVERKIAETLSGCDERITAVIRRRVDAMGTNEPVIQSLPKKHQLIVQLPGADEELRKAAKARLQSMAFLEFRMTHPLDNDLVSRLLAKDTAPEGYEKKGRGYARIPGVWEKAVAKSGYAARLAAFGTTDDRYRFMLEDNKDGTYSPHFVSRRVELTGENLESAAWARDDLKGGFQVKFSLDAEGGRKFSELTRKYKPNGTQNRSSARRALAIVLDDTLVSAPYIESEIGSEGVITGRFTLDEARRLASDLNAGALPAPLKILAESSVAPTVGDDAIRSGRWAAVIGFTLVAMFMLFYYRRAGLVADIALFLDVALLPTALVIVANLLGVFAQDPSMGGGGSAQLPVLTMPGIAGLILTLGMAVDANVLVFERIREEFQRGEAAGVAIKNGYGRAFSAILDSNLTTIITGIILFVVGTGPVRGFAIMLTGGVVISMFTAVVVTRLVFDHTVNPASTKPFKMVQFFKSPRFDFMSVGKKTLCASIVAVVALIGIFAFRLVKNPASVLAVDLTGGTSIVYNVTPDESKQPSAGDIRKALDGFDNAAVIQYQRGVGSTTLLVKTGESAETAKGRAVKNSDVGAHVTSLLQAAFPDAGITAASVEEVGSMVGADLKKSGTKAVLFSLVAILVYVGFRFRFGFGLGGVVALAHDALIALGVFSICGRQVSLIVVTALLTIIGYSINDTVVVFDRIREQLSRDRRSSFADICNSAINACLGRTVMTSLTTFLAVLALFLFGDGSIYDFALTMLIGVVAGTYSSVFIAVPVMAWWYKGKRPDVEEDTDGKRA